MSSCCAKPSISAKNWFKVDLEELCSEDLRVPASKESISSIKIIQGLFFFATLKSLRRREAPTPTNISSKSEPVKKMKLTPDSPATA